MSPYGMGDFSRPSSLLVSDNRQERPYGDNNQHTVSKSSKMATVCAKKQNATPIDQEQKQFEWSAGLRYLATMAKDLQKAAADLESQYAEAGLETVYDIHEYLSRLMDELNDKTNIFDRSNGHGHGQELHHQHPHKGNLKAKADSNDVRWIKESIKRVEQGHRFVRDCQKCARLAKGSGPAPFSFSGAPAVMNGSIPSQEQEQKRESPLSLTHSLGEIRERLHILGSPTTQRCFVSLYKRDKLGEAHPDDHVLIANAGPSALQQKADAIYDAKQFLAVYGQDQGSPVAVKFIEIYRRLYGLTPEEGRGSLREGPVTDIINEHANHLFEAEPVDLDVIGAFARFIREVRKWSYLPGVGHIIVPEYGIDEDLEKVYLGLRHKLDAAAAHRQEA